MPIKKSHAGFALIEAMIAIVVMALGILGILGVQMRTLTDTQTGVRRAQAIRAVEDLSERMKVNPSALENIDSYVTGWGTVSPSVDCKANPCNAKDLAVSDVQQWKRTIQGNPSAVPPIPGTLPMGDANIFLAADETIPGNRRQLGVMISWRENERTDGSAADNTAYRNPFAVSSGGANVSCPAGRICHLQYIQLTSRCNVYRMAGTSTNQFICPA